MSFSHFIVCNYCDYRQEYKHTTNSPAVYPLGWTVVQTSVISKFNTSEDSRHICYKCIEKLKEQNLHLGESSKSSNS